jgi:2-methylcitrate dehydratase PrpD
MTEQRLDSGRVAHVAVHVDPRLLRLLYVGWPRTPYEAKFCLRFNLAATLTGHLPDVQLSVDAPYDDPVLTEARERVEVIADRPGQGDDVEVVVTTTDGRQFTRDSAILHGSARDRMSEDEVFAKFERSVTPVVPRDVAASLRDAIMRLDEDASDGLWDTWRQFTAATRAR